MTKRIEVAVGIIINANKQVLIAERPPGKVMPGLWEFPGGKVEPNEPIYDALKRELKEELNLDVIAATPWFQTTYDYAEFPVLLHNWFITEYEGEPEGLEEQQFKWVRYEELAEYEFPKANDSIVEALRDYLLNR